MLIAITIYSAPASEPAHFLGAQSCSSSSCHGGAGDKSNQFTRWRNFDFHSRAYATLTTARSERLAETLKIGKATESARCTICHAPAATLEPTILANKSIILEGVSCESCHGLAEPWLRSHTRPDLAHAVRVQLGLRELGDPYSRANACVACHQNLDPDVLAAGHPELIFELDGQGASQPRHWTERYPHAQLWLVGQAVALREMSAQMIKLTNENIRLQHRTQALAWLLQKSVEGSFDFPKTDSILEIQRSADALAKAASQNWNTNTALKLIRRMAQLAPEFRNNKVPADAQARRAERLVLALDRLVLDLHPSVRSRLEKPLAQLFDLSQNIPEFRPTRFSTVLDQFEKFLLAE